MSVSLPEGKPITPSPVEAKPTRNKKPSPQKLRFENSKGFQRELRKRTDEYFEHSGISKRDSPSMYFKTIFILFWFVASYSLLVFAPLSVIGVIVASASLSLAMAAVGFNIQHDGGHRAFSNNPIVNKLTALSLDLVGGSSYLWNWKHNHFHHTYANITGHDDDIEMGIFGRLSPHQKRLFFHRLQHIYVWFLYGLIVVKWHLFDDFKCVVKGKIGDHDIPRPKGWDLALFLLGKALFLTVAFVIPSFFHPFLTVALFYLAVTYVQGIVLSVVFQLAHCVEEADFPMPVEGTNRMKSEFYIHQIETTVNFARRNKLLNWYVGGLNFQVEHHLFPNISHVHYPELSKIVQKTCEDFGVHYNSHDTLFSSLRSHYRFLRRMGRANPA